MKDSDELYLTDLISVDVLQKLQDAFSDMTGMAALTTDKYGIPVTEGSNFSDFCFKYTRESALGNSRCMRCDKTGAELTMSSKKPCYYYCHAGLVDFAAPIMADGKMVGSFIGGQVLPSPPDMEIFEKTAIELGIDPVDYKEAVSKVKIVDDQTIDKSAKFLYIVAECLSHLAYQSYELHKSNLEIEKASNLKSDFLANMSHEIRTPMNAVLGMIELALREEMSPAAKEYIYQMKASAKNLLVIINDILDFSKIESGKMDILNVVYEPLSILNDLASIANSKIGGKPVEFTMNLEPNMPKALYGDNVRIHQIILNLITNAIKFTRQGEVHLDFNCVPDINDHDMVIMNVSVSDTGIGIKEEDFRKLFNSFQQVDSKRNRNIEGTGLGLVICKQLLELMNGTIAIESEYGKGSTFSFKLPQKIVDHSPAIPKLEKEIHVGVLLNNQYAIAQILKDLERIGSIPIILSNVQNPDELNCDYIIISSDYFTDSIKEYLKNHDKIKCIIITEFGDISNIFYPNVKILNKPIYSLSLYNAMGMILADVNNEDNENETFTFIAPEAKVLIVDDNSVNLKVAKGLIDPLNMKIDTATSAAQAIEMVSSIQYDIVFMDHMMPEVDGIEATHIIRRMIPSYKDTPIIALTANAVSGAKELFINEGMSDFVAKPIEIKDIVSKIRKWLPPEKILLVDKNECEADAANNNSRPIDIPELNVDNAVKMLGSEKLYLTVLEEYYNSITEKSQSIKKHYLDKNWKKYTVEVHSLKSTSRQIGAEHIGEIAAELEQAGHEKNLTLIKEKTDCMLSEYLSFKDVLAPMFERYEVSAYECDDNTLYQLLSDMSEILDTLDVLEIDDMFNKINQNGFADGQQVYFDKLHELYENADIDGCHHILTEWQNIIGNSEKPDEVPIDTIKLLDDLKDALNDFDILRIDDAVSILAKNSYPEPQQEQLEFIRKCVADGDIDRCMNAIKNWQELMEK